MNTIHRPTLLAVPIASMLTLALTVGAAAQVATLADPEATPEPESVEAILEFEDQNEALLAYAECMRDNDIDMDDPQAGTTGGRGFFGGGPDGGEPAFDRFSAEFQSAQEACGPILEATRPDTDPEAEQERLEQELLLAQCVRDNGYEQYPDPVIGPDGRLQRAGGQDFESLGIDRRSDAFREVMATCRDEIGLEQFGLGGGLGTGAGLGQGGN